MRLDYKQYLEGTNQVLVKSQEKEKSPYMTIVQGKEFIVLPNVFSPAYFNDTEFFAANIPIAIDETILEIGSGTGAVAISAAYRGAERVVAMDINPDAVINTRANVERHDLSHRIDVRESNLYNALQKDEKFDTIFWNTPFGYVEDTNISSLEKAIYDPGYKSIEAFVKGAHMHLQPGGRLIIGFSTTLGRFDLLEKFVREADMSLKLMLETDSLEMHPVKFELFEASPWSDSSKT